MIRNGMKCITIALVFFSILSERDPMTMCIHNMQHSYSLFR